MGNAANHATIGESHALQLFRNIRQFGLGRAALFDHRSRITQAGALQRTGGLEFRRAAAHSENLRRPRPHIFLYKLHARLGAKRRGHICHGSDRAGTFRRLQRSQRAAFQPVRKSFLHSDHHRTAPVAGQPDSSGHAELRGVGAAAFYSAAESCRASFKIFTSRTTCR